MKKNQEMDEQKTRKMVKDAIEEGKKQLAL